MTQRDSPQQTQRSDADPLIDALLAEFVPGDPQRRSRPPNLTAKIIAQLASPAADPTDSEFDDADPLVDSLLAEFVASDPERRSSPPDLSASILEKLEALQSESGIDADPVIDALLPEFVPSNPRRQKTPPNLVEGIFTQLDAPLDADAKSSSLPTDLAEPPAKSMALARILSVIAGIAASILAVIWLTGQINDQGSVAENITENISERSPKSDPDASLAANNPAQAADVADAIVDAATIPQPQLAESESPQPVKPIRGIPLDSPSLAMQPASDRQDDAGDENTSESIAPVLPIATVAAKSDATARQYWNNLGITPTPDAPADQVASRLKERLGIELSAESLSDPQRLRDFLAQASNANQIATRWLAVTTSTPIPMIAHEDNQSLIQELAAGVSGNARLDTTLVSLIDGTNKQSDRWYATIGRGGMENIAKHLASISINADVRCVRCHDSHIGRSGTQDDYWSFVALVRSVISRENDRWVVADKPRAFDQFYELLDGRQQVAEPKVSGYLLQSDRGITDFQKWTQTLAGSNVLAESMVDSLWKLVHGRPLRPSPVDAFAPPVDNRLNELHQLLAQDLKANQFDVARTLALIISSPMTNRSTPEALQGNALLTTTDQQRANALELVGAFAASIESPRSSLNQRVDVAMRRIGSSLSAGESDTVLAQPIVEIPLDPNSRTRPNDSQPVVSFTQQLSVDFPGNDSSLPVSWLRTIEDFDLQVQHLAYLSGRNTVSPEISDAAKRLRESSDRETALSRIWWILRD